MIFNSISFLIFFAAVLIVHYAPISNRIKKYNLLAANILFFASYHPPYILLLAVSTVVDWLIANKIDKSEGAPRKHYLYLSVALNIGVLCFFKYADFALDNFKNLLLFFDIVYNPTPLGLILPVGISFYTFQALSYTIDVYYKKIKPEPELINFSMFVLFFPHLVAGPILRARDILPQCRNLHLASKEQFFWGICLLVWGLFQKVILADLIFAPTSDFFFNPQMQLTALESWSAALAFTGQIFFDFAGYSTCAIGVALSLGFIIPDNFNYPYLSIGFSDFWKRWHISLSSWLRDYCYIPMGGNKVSNWKTNRNLLFTMLLGGLWHGAAWHFVVWGAYHGMLLIIEKKVKSIFIKIKFLKYNKFFKFLSWLITLHLVVVGWVFFRAHDVNQALNIVSNMHSNLIFDVQNASYAKVFFPIVFLFASILIQSFFKDKLLSKIFINSSPVLSGVLMALMIATICFFAGKQTGFIYFQF